MNAFKEMYIDIVINQKRPMTDELNSLFEDVLIHDFDGDVSRMDAFIQSINEEATKQETSELDQLKQGNEQLRQRVDMSEEALLELSDMVLAATKGVK